MSLALHAVLLVFLIHGLPKTNRPPERSIPRPLDIELIISSPLPASEDPPAIRPSGGRISGETAGPAFSSEAADEAAEGTENTTDLAALPSAKPEPADQMPPARTILSTGILNGPKGRAIRASLQLAANDERLIQICNLETLAQIKAAHPAMEPDYVIAYAGGPVELVKGELTADRAALRADGRWHFLEFRCKADPVALEVAAFAFRLGAQIPKRDWDRLNLPYD
ncbi:DUF930 domain-containing protein [Roseibium sp. RKSG952]|uniref:DUF930 domain-containing protein n=1 Tax=Roseibium sp. RKSG952 TaxID=2529384 RepID=UPI0018AD0FEF|nr:DUF930 domain-containing protein [Roseibium sp. RKSG952]